MQIEASMHYRNTLYSKTSTFLKMGNTLSFDEVIVEGEESSTLYVHSSRSQLEVRPEYIVPRDRKSDFQNSAQFFSGASMRNRPIYLAIISSAMAIAPKITNSQI
jgi:hypothetical protein